MSPRRPGTAAGADRGFTLIEALVALAIGGLVIATLATVTGQWLRGWGRGLGTLQRAGTLVSSLDRVGADLAAARYVPAGPTGRDILFAGSDAAVTFVRRTLPVEVPAGLEMVRLGPQPGSTDVTVERTRAPYRQAQGQGPINDPAPVVLLRAPYRLAFAYAGDDGRWTDAWRGLASLPRRVRVTLVDRSTGRDALAPIVVALRVGAPATCAAAGSARACAAARTLDPPAGAENDAGPVTAQRAAADAAQHDE